MEPCSSENKTKISDGAECNYTSQLKCTGFGEKTWRDAADIAKTRKIKMSSTFLFLKVSEK